MLEEQHENFVVAVTLKEMLATTNQMQGENERQWKKVTENTYYFTIKENYSINSTLVDIKSPIVDSLE